MDYIQPYLGKLNDPVSVYFYFYLSTTYCIISEPPVLSYQIHSITWYNIHEYKLFIIMEQNLE